MQGQTQSDLLEMANRIPGVCREGGGGPWRSLLWWRGDHNWLWDGSVCFSPFLLWHLAGSTANASLGRAACSASSELEVGARGAWRNPVFPEGLSLMGFCLVALEHWLKQSHCGLSLRTSKLRAHVGSKGGFSSSSWKKNPPGIIT